MNFLIRKNLLVYGVSWLTASLLFPFGLLLFKEPATYGWWFFLLLAGVLNLPVFLPSIGVVLLFNAIVRREQRVFSNRSMLLLLGGTLWGITFFILNWMVYSQRVSQVLENSLLMGMGGGVFGFYYY